LSGSGDNGKVYICACICACMVKVISLSEEAYRKLRTLKHGKSFSEVVIEIVDERKRKKDLSRFFGAFKEDADEWEKIKKKIYEDRKKFKLREVKFDE
jgi:predicted CopG family antitoxin